MKRKYEEMNLQKLSQIDPKYMELEKEREEMTKVRNVEQIVFQDFKITTWYFSPFPEEYGNSCKQLYICDGCLKYMQHSESFASHKSTCKRNKPPGTLIYEKNGNRIYEIDGKQDKLYCQCLCLLSKLFLDHKTVYYDIESFLFYVLTFTEKKKGKSMDQVVGYFSKEKNSAEGYNLACILVLPPHQRKGYGRLLIEFSYELSKLERKIGSPERPLSDLGLVGYRSYWQAVLLDILSKNKNTKLSIKDLSILTSIRQEDIVSTLSSMDMIKLWKGEHVLCVTPSMITNYIKENKVQLQRAIDPFCIIGK